MKTSETIVTKAGFLTVTHKQNPSCIYFDWENFSISLDDCVDAFHKAEKAMTKRGVFHIVSDILKVKQGLRPEVGQWWGEVCLPSLARCGVKLIVNLVPMTGDNKAGDSQVVNGIVMQTAHTLAEAEAFVAAFGNTKTIEKELRIQAKPERVFKAITEKKELETWFVRKAEIQLKVDGDLRVEWAPGMAEHGKIKEVKPSELLRFTWQAFSPTPTTITFHLQKEGDGTLLRLTHGGIGDGEGWGDYYSSISAGWSAHLKDLTSWVETGTCPPPGPRG